MQWVALSRHPCEGDIALKPCMALPHTLPWCPGKIGSPGSPAASLRSSSFWMIIQNASLWEQTTWTPSRSTRHKMGKNTVMHKAIQRHLENNPVLEKLLPHMCVCGGAVWGILLPRKTSLRSLLLATKVPAASHTGAIAHGKFLCQPRTLVRACEDLLLSSFRHHH